MCESTTLDLAGVAERIASRRAMIPSTQAVLVAVSGIDASGKGYVTQRLAEAVAALGLRPGIVHGDGWLHLPNRRFSVVNPGAHFYENAFRFDEMFSRLVLPLRRSRSSTLDADFTDETAVAYRRHRYRYVDIDVILLEAVFLLKHELRPHYDVSVWIDCSFQTALRRALLRNQERLSPTEILRAYETIYFPAQRIHFRRDAPHEAADCVVNNDAARENEGV